MSATLENHPPRRGSETGASPQSSGDRHERPSRETSGREPSDWAALSSAFRSTSGRSWVIVAAAFVIVCAGVRAAAPILAPTVLGAYLATVNMPFVGWLRRRGVPLTPTVMLVLLADTVLLSGFLGLLFLASTNLSHSLPRYATLLEGWAASSPSWLGSYDLSTRLTDVLHDADALRFAAALAGQLAGGVWDVVIALIIAAFLLLRFGSSTNPSEPPGGLLGTDRARRALVEANRYVAVKTATSMATGLLIGGFSWLVGAELPVLFGVLALVLNYIPNLGSIAAALPAIGLGLLAHGVEHAALLTLGYGAANLLIGNILEPRVMGRALGLWPVVVLLSVMFWGFLLGVIGALLSALLTALLKMALLATDDLRSFGLLLGPRPPRLASPGQTSTDLLEETLPQTQEAP